MENTVFSHEINDIAQDIVRKFSPEKIVLFGSYAWGNPRPESDVDLFIIKKTKKNKRERQRELRTLLFPPALPLDLLIYTPEETKRRLEMEDFFVNDILTKGKILYDAKQ